MTDMLQSDFEDFCRAHQVDAVGVFVDAKERVSGFMDATVLMHPDHVAFKPQGRVCQDLCAHAVHQIQALRRAREKLAGNNGDTFERDPWHRD